MHKSRLAGLIIDCDTDDLQAAADFWSKALGAPAKHAADLPASPYVELQMPMDEPYVEVQKVDHASRVHVDIESDDVDLKLLDSKILRRGLLQSKNGWFLKRRPGNGFVLFLWLALTSPQEHTPGTKKNEKGR